MTTAQLSFQSKFASPRSSAWPCSPSPSKCEVLLTWGDIDANEKSKAREDRHVLVQSSFWAAEARSTRTYLGIRPNLW